jgi:hypothetical protein
MHRIVEEPCFSQFGNHGDSGLEEAGYCRESSIQGKKIKVISSDLISEKDRQSEIENA